MKEYGNSKQETVSHACPYNDFRRYVLFSVLMGTAMLVLMIILVLTFFFIFLQM